MKRLILAGLLIASSLQAADQAPDHADIPLWQRQLLSEMVKQAMDNSVITKEPMDLQSPDFFKRLEVIKQRSIVVEVYSSRSDWQVGASKRLFRRHVDKESITDETVENLKELILGGQKRQLAMSAIVANAPSPLQDRTKLKDIQSSTVVAWDLDAKEAMAEEEQKKVAAHSATITLSTPNAAPAPARTSWCSKLCGNRGKS